MTTALRDIMTPDPRTMPATTSVADAARTMRDEGIGDVLVHTDDHSLRGIVTDRDITVRAVAEGRAPDATTIGDLCTGDMTSAGIDEDPGDVAARMRADGVRRMPVVEDGRPIGIVSIGDLAIERDTDSALADISAQEPNARR